MRLRLSAIFLLLCLFLTIPAQAQEPAPPVADPSPITRIKLPGDDGATAKLIRRVAPVYPPLARQTRISGTVRLHVIVAKDGGIQSLSILQGHPFLQQAALDAVRLWRYEPTMLNGEPVEVDTTIDVVFALTEHPRSTAPYMEPTAGVPARILTVRQRNILQMLDVMHFQENAAKSSRRVFESLRPALSSSIPGTSNRDQIVDVYVEKLVGLTRSDRYVDRVVAVYERYFSDEDVRALIQFYQTPAGQHFNAVMPDLFGDLNELGQSVAMDNLPGVIQELCEQFPELKEDARFCKGSVPAHRSQSSAPDTLRADGQ